MWKGPLSIKYVNVFTTYNHFKIVPFLKLPETARETVANEWPFSSPAGEGGGGLK